MQVIIEESEYKELKKKETYAMRRLEKKNKLLTEQVEELRKIKFKRLFVSYRSRDCFMFPGIPIDPEIYELEDALRELKSNQCVDFPTDKELKDYLEKRHFEKHNALRKRINEFYELEKRPWIEKVFGIKRQEKKQ